MVAKKSKAPKPASENKTGEVNEFLAGLEHPLKAEIEALRALILGADQRITESIKWNAPSFSIQEHFATFNLRPGKPVQVVFHTGAKTRADRKDVEIDDPAGLLKWAAQDRCVATFSGMEDVETNQAAFVAIVQQWIQQMPPSGDRHSG
jgi:hypothetical protein